MGLSFISEGAIPFTLSKPKVIIPANVIGGAVTGLLIGALGVSISAPHGGILTVALCRLDSTIYPTAVEGLKIGLGITFFIVAIIAASFKIFSKSAPEKPAVFLAIIFKSTSSANLFCLL